MEYGVFKVGIASIFEGSYETKYSELGRISAIVDEGLYGMGVRITGKEENGYVPIITHYGYIGYVKVTNLLGRTKEEIKEWEDSELMVVDCFCADVWSIPKVQGIRLLTLTKGALVEVIEWEKEKLGWAKIRLLDGEYGFIRTQFLRVKNYSQAGLWEKTIPQAISIKETEFRENVVNTALSYLGVQYRWGGKTPMGIDCSGVVSMSYMLQGIIIFRDAKLMPEFPVREVPMTQIKKGDLLYFPGHIAMYLGNDKILHATAKVGSGGAVIDSLYPNDANYREDLAKSLYAVGSIF